jgi:hypothetical protein
MPASIAKSRPIIFSSESVRAILAGRKTQTRRVVKPQPTSETDQLWYLNGQWRWGRQSSWFIFSPPYAVGDRLWVREMWRQEKDEVYYKADESLTGSWYSSPIFMPRWASRIDLEVTAVKVERLQSITEEDAVKEGFKVDVPETWWQGYRLVNGNYWQDQACGDTPPHWMLEPKEISWHGGIPACRGRFIGAWEKINGKKHPWDANPWVAVYEFKRIKP